MPEAWKVTSSHRRSAASERLSSPSRSTAQIATSTRPPRERMGRDLALEL